MQNRSCDNAGDQHQSMGSDHGCFGAFQVRCLCSISSWLLTQCTNTLPVTMCMLRVWRPGAACYQPTLHDPVERVMKKGKDYTFRRNINKKPGNIPGCSKHDPVCNACMYGI